ncbi:C-type lectin lectoxin-Thr1-like [Physella acuta]|uniref:C-type lectin lectoxin-Thr1-like n=1 Tax=Physella acuta TaxID=109671 RepID=UPI0027DE4806|nr:C-type lectin lectoxin-Thr1-like [Physella acuta]
MLSSVALTECTEPDWWYYNEHCYFHVRERKTWSDAQSFCRQHHANLASIESKDEAEYIEKKNVNNVWIGLYKTDQGKDWEWVSGEKKIEYLWDAGQPQNKSVEGLNCAITTKEGFWENYFCFDRSYFVCETQANKPSCPQKISM